MIIVNPAREVLEEQLELLERAMTVTLRSKLNAGILLIPEDLQAWNSETEEEPDHAFEDELFEALLAPVRDIDSLSSYLPFIIRGPVDLLSEVRHIKFGNDGDIEAIQGRIDSVRERLAWLDKAEEDMV